MDLTKIKLPELKKLCRQNKIPAYSKYKKDEIIEILNSLENIELLPENVILDEDQEKAVALSKTEKTLLINAGPGSGKTLTLSHIVKDLALSLNDKRILVISYNNEAEKRLRNMLKNMDVKLLTKNAKYGEKGVRVCTFHHLALLILQNRGKKFIQEQKLISDATFYVDETPKNDYLIIDEAHDVTAELIEFCRALQKHSRNTVLAGDFKQEITDSINWFSELYSNPSLTKHVLRYNHRSCSRIVDLLNSFSQKIFPEVSESPQICVTEKRGRVFFHNVEEDKIAECLFETILKFPDAFIISPISITKYGCFELFQAVNQRLYDENYPFKIKSCSDDDKIISDETFIFSVSSGKIKGCEKRSVIVIKGELDYLKYGNIPDHLAKRKLYVALSRAQRNLIVIHSSKIRNDYFSALPLSGDVKKYDSYSVKDISQTFNDFDISKHLNKMLKIDQESYTKNVKIDLDLPSTFKNEMFRNVLLFYLSKKYKFTDLKRNDFISKTFFEKSYPEEEKSEFISLYKNKIKEYSNYFPFKIGECSSLKKYKGICLRSEMPSKINIKSFSHFVNSKNEIVDVIYLKDKKKINEFLYRSAAKCLLSKENVICYNACSGKTFNFCLENVKIPHFWSFSIVEHLARTHYFMRYATNLKKYQRVALHHDIKGKVLVTFDLETWNCFPKRGCTLLEAGGIAVYENGEILSMIYDNGDAILFQNELLYENDEAANNSSSRIYAECEEWSSSFNHQEVSLKWAAQESDYLIIGAKPEFEIDVMDVYKRWRELNGINRSHQDGYRSLSDCSFDLFNNIIPFRAHNAFEDSFMTLICFMAMVKW